MNNNEYEYKESFKAPVGDDLNEKVRDSTNLLNALAYPIQHGDALQHVIGRHNGKFFRIENNSQMKVISVPADEKLFIYSAPDIPGNSGPKVYYATTTFPISYAGVVVNSPKFSVLQFESPAFFDGTKAVAMLSSSLIIRNVNSSLTAGGFIQSGVTQRTVSPGELASDGIPDSSVVGALTRDGDRVSVHLTGDKAAMTVVTTPSLPDAMQPMGAALRGRISTNVYKLAASEQMLITSFGAPKFTTSASAHMTGVHMQSLMANVHSAQISVHNPTGVIGEIEVWRIDGTKQTYTSPGQCFEIPYLEDPIAAIGIAATAVETHVTVTQFDNAPNEYSQRGHIHIMDPSATTQSMAISYGYVLARVVSANTLRTLFSSGASEMPHLTEALRVMSESGVFTPCAMAIHHTITSKISPVVSFAIMAHENSSAVSDPNIGAAGPWLERMSRISRDVIRRLPFAKDWKEPVKSVIFNTITNLIQQHPAVAKPLAEFIRMYNEKEVDPETGEVGAAGPLDFILKNVLGPAVLGAGQGLIQGLGKGISAAAGDIGGAGLPPLSRMRISRW